MEGALTGGKTVGVTDERKKGRGSSSVVVRDMNSSSPGNKTCANNKLQLIPGIPDEITLNSITPKLPLKDVLALPLVSPLWQHAVHSRQVYHARVRALATAYLLVHRVDDLTSNGSKIRLGVRSRGGTFLRTLPAIPDSWAENDDMLYKHMCDDGKIYIMGLNLRHVSVFATVSVFDLAGRRQWTECARSQLELREFSWKSSLCCVKEKKFYISGILITGAARPGHVIYDPVVDSWSSTTDFLFDAAVLSCICSNTTSRLAYHRCWV